MEKTSLLTEKCDYTNVFDVLELFKLPTQVISKLVDINTFSLIEVNIVTKEQVMELVKNGSTDGDFSKLDAYLDAKYNGATFAPKADVNDVSKTAVVLSMSAAKQAIAENVYTEEKLLASSRPAFRKLIEKKTIEDIKSGKVKIADLESNPQKHVEQANNNEDTSIYGSVYNTLHDFFWPQADHTNG